MSGVLVIVVVIVAWGGVVALMLRGWRNRGRRQVDHLGPFPDAPAEPGELHLGPDTGVYVGSTISPSWQDRVAVGDYGDRANATMSWFDGGILLARNGANPIWIPAESIVAVRTERGLAGKVMTADGVLVIRWRLPSGIELDSGVRGDDKNQYRVWTERFAEIVDGTADHLTAPSVSEESAAHHETTANKPDAGTSPEIDHTTRGERA